MFWYWFQKWQRLRRDPSVRVEPLAAYTLMTIMAYDVITTDIRTLSSKIQHLHQRHSALSKYAGRVFVETCSAHSTILDHSYNHHFGWSDTTSRMVSIRPMLKPSDPDQSVSLSTFTGNVYQIRIPTRYKGCRSSDCDWCHQCTGLSIKPN